MSFSALAPWRIFRASGPSARQGLNVCDNLIVIMYCLRIVGCEYDLRGRQLGEANTHPLGASLGGIIGTRPSGTIVKQSMLQIIIE